jgi:hypothetical protein
VRSTQKKRDGGVLKMRTVRPEKDPAEGRNTHNSPTMVNPEVSEGGRIGQCHPSQDGSGWEGVSILPGRCRSY